MFYAYTLTKKWDIGFTVNGFLAGLVAITCPCYWVSPTGAIILGGVAGVIVCLGVELLEWLRIDDPIGAVPVHGFCGIWGTWSLGLFACGKYGASGPAGPDNSAALNGLFYHGGFTLLKAQVIGNGIITLSTFGIALLLMYLVNLTGTLRVSEEGELYGLDLHEHGIRLTLIIACSACGHAEGPYHWETLGTDRADQRRLSDVADRLPEQEDQMTKIEAIIRPNKFESRQDRSHSARY